MQASFWLWNQIDVRYKPTEIFLSRPSCWHPGLNSLGQQPIHTFFINPISPADQRRRVDRRTILEECLSREVLIIGVFDPAGDHRLVLQPIGMLEIQQALHQTRLGDRTTSCRREEPRPFPVKYYPGDWGSQLYQPTHGEGRSCRPIAGGGDHPVLEGANCASLASPNLQGFKRDFTKRCTTWRENPKLKRMKSMKWQNEGNAQFPGQSARITLP